MSMRLTEITNPLTPAHTTALNITGVADSSRWARYGPAVLQAVEEISKGRYTTALVTALKAAAPDLPINSRVQQGLSTASDLELLSTIVRNPAALATFLATFSRGAGEGEDEAMKRIHAQQDAQQGPTLAQK
jgi:hypothetical protein